MDVPLLLNWVKFDVVLFATTVFPVICEELTYVDSLLMLLVFVVPHPSRKL